MVFRKLSETTEPKCSTHAKGVHELRGVEWEPPRPYVYKKCPRKDSNFRNLAPSEPNRPPYTSPSSAKAAMATWRVAWVVVGLGPTAAAAAETATAVYAAATAAGAASQRREDWGGGAGADVPAMAA